MVALLVAIEAAQLSALWARFPLPVIPAPGDPIPVGAVAAGARGLPAAGSDRRRPPERIHRRRGVAQRAGVGGDRAASRGAERRGWYVVAATAATSVLRARVWDSAACKAWLLAQPYLAAGVLLVIYTATGRYAAALGAVAGARRAGVGVGRGGAEPADRLAGKLFAARCADWWDSVASGLDASLIPVIAYLVGLFAWVLNR